MDRPRSWLRTSIANGVALTATMLAARPVDAQPVTMTPAAPLVDARVATAGATTPLTERERLLLARIEQLERRLTEVEARVGSSVSPDPNAAEAAASPAPDQAVETSEKGGVKLVPHAVLVGSAAYDTYGLIPGSIAFYG